MSNFVVAVGGCGAKLLQTLIHLSAAGLLPEHRPELFGQLVDPDENNGNVDDTLKLYKLYRQCRNTLLVGKSDLLNARIEVDGPWTPIRDRVDTLNQIFQFDKLERSSAVDADLFRLFFDHGERNMAITQGFRGRPAIGATVLAEAVDFSTEPWSTLKERIKAKGTQGSVHVLLAGSVFGGSGASGVPTLVRLLEKAIDKDVPDLRLGLVLFLPYFQFRPVPGEEIQADPAAFPAATAEALKYYHERGFLAFCRSIYAVGEEIPSDVAMAAVGASDQRNEPHFAELVAGMGAMRFFNDKVQADEGQLSIAGRAAEGTLTWADLPLDEAQRSSQIKRLQAMATFAVAYRYLFFPAIEEALKKGKSDFPFWVENIERQKPLDREEAGQALHRMNEYTGAFLTWLMHVSCPRRVGFTPGLVDPNVFSIHENSTWRLKRAAEFRDAGFPALLLNTGARKGVDARELFQRAARPVKDPNATGAGRLVRALYDACVLN